MARVSLGSVTVAPPVNCDRLSRRRAMVRLAHGLGCQTLKIIG
jgi:hypothetical protein